MALLFAAVPMAFANVDYNESGNFDNDFSQGTLLFDQGIDITGFFGLNDGKQSPLVTDLDGDGINEIIVLDLDTFRLFNTRFLTILDAFPLTANERYSNFITFDIDGDGLTEIIIALEQSNLIEIVQWNGTVMTSETISYSAIPDANSAGNGGQVLLKCRDTNECMMSYVTFDAKSTNNRIRVASFNSTAIGNSTENLKIPLASKGSAFCFPLVRTAEFVDFDNTGTISYIFSVFDMRVLNTDDEVDIYYIKPNPTDFMLAPTVNLTINIGAGLMKDVASATSCSGDNLGKFITSPLVTNLDGAVSNGLETVIGFNEDADEFKMILFNSGGANTTTFPAAADADGEIISNVMITNIFDDTTLPDFCVLGFDATGNQIDLLCASFGMDRNPLPPPFTVNNAQFLIDLDDLPNPFNITSDVDSYNSIIHSINIIGTDDEDEMLASYGIFDFDLKGVFCTGIFSIGSCSMSLSLESARIDTTLIPVDVEKLGRNDILSLEVNRITYFDDQFVNQPGIISNVFNNPCFDQGTLKINTTLDVVVTVIDNESDQISSRVTIYKDDINEQVSGFLANVSSGQPQTHTFSLNKTAGTVNMLVEGRDIQNLLTIDEQPFTFSVGTNGLEFGDCTQSTDFVVVPGVPTIIIDATINEDASTNAIVTGLDSLQGISGLAGTSIWLVFMLALTAGLWFEGAKMRFSGGTLLGAIGIANLLMIILGVRLGILSTSLIVIITILGILIIAVTLGRFLTGTSARM